MSRLSQLGEAGLRRALSEGLTIATGPFRFRLQSHDERVARNLARLYAEFDFEPDRGLRDFHIHVDRVTGPRRYFRPQVNFWLDGGAPFRPLPADHSFALLEWGMNWCIAGQAHHYLLLHAAVLERHGRCVVLPGEPGAGKSTLTAALMLSGWRLLSDELTIVDRDDGLLVGLARPVSLKNASIDIVRTRYPDAIFGDTAHETHKGSVSHLRPSAESVARQQDKGRPAHIVFPRWAADADTRLVQRGKADAFMALAGHSFNYSLLGALGFRLASDLIDRCGCWDFQYSRLDEALAVFEDLVS